MTVSFKEKIAALKKEFEEELVSIGSSKDLEQVKVRFLGKKGPIALLMKDLKQCSPEERPLAGKWINELKEYVASHLDFEIQKFKNQELEERLCNEKIDISLPGREVIAGGVHPLSQMIDRVVDILSSMGFSVYSAPEVESEYYNYGGLNYPDDHPARDMQDTYYIDENTLLRSHTTSFQQRILESNSPPIRLCCPGKCYRNETISARSHVIFHQIDVMCIDKGVTFGDLLSTLEEFYSKLFDEKVEIRVRASYFPFVEPGMEVDVKCTLCKGEGCTLCKDSGWLEVCGAGLIHPEVLKNGGIDPEVYSGFAWGGGIERIYLLLHGIHNIRLFLENDMRFLKQFP